jgi:hypothetical protein
MVSACTCVNLLTIISTYPMQCMFTLDSRARYRKNLMYIPDAEAISKAMMTIIGESHH